MRLGFSCPKSYLDGAFQLPYPNIRVTYCQSSAMSFFFTQYSFCNSFRHGLLPVHHLNGSKLPCVNYQLSKQFELMLNINQYSRSYVIEMFMALIGRHVFVTSICNRYGLATCNIFGFLGYGMKLM